MNHQRLTHHPLVTEFLKLSPFLFQEDSTSLPPSKITILESSTSFHLSRKYQVYHIVLCVSVLLCSEDTPSPYSSSQTFLISRLNPLPYPLGSSFLLSYSDLTVRSLLNVGVWSPKGTFWILGKTYCTFSSRVPGRVGDTSDSSVTPKVFNVATRDTNTDLWGSIYPCQEQKFLENRVTVPDLVVFQKNHFNDRWQRLKVEKNTDET